MSLALTGLWRRMANKPIHIRTHTMYSIINIQDIMAHSGISICKHKAQWMKDRLPEHFTVEQVLALAEEYSILAA